MTNPDIKNPATPKINDYETYETEVYGQITGKSSLLYYCVVTKGDVAIVVQGIAKENAGQNVEEFKKLAYTVLLK